MDQINLDGKLFQNFYIIKNYVSAPFKVLAHLRCINLPSPLFLTMHDPTVQFYSCMIPFSYLSGSNRLHPDPFRNF